MSSIGISPHGDIESPLPEMIGTSDAMLDVYQKVRRVAQSNAAVMLIGEPGTGKELVAKAIHRLSRRANGPFVRVHCGEHPQTSHASELFGHVQGSFAGAVADHCGGFSSAAGGTLFIDEIHNTSLDLQANLVRVLQEHQIKRVGDSESITVDARVIAATKRNLTEEVIAERFREDLYWRLNVVPIEIPPLRQRGDDIVPLVAHFLKLFSEANERSPVDIDPAALNALQNYHWPGNVRELENYIERAIVMNDGDQITLDLLPPEVTGCAGRSKPKRSSEARDLDSMTTEIVEQGLLELADDKSELHTKIVDRIERELINQVLQACEGVQKKAALQLGMNRNTLHKKIKTYGLDINSQ